MYPRPHTPHPPTIQQPAAFGFRLVPIEPPAEPSPGDPSVKGGGEVEGEGGGSAKGAAQRNPYLGFEHVTEAVWIMGVPVPLSLALTADGVSMPHVDGKGWRVEVEVSHAVVGRVVTYKGDVRMVS